MAHDTYRIYQTHVEVAAVNLIPPNIYQTHVEIVSKNYVTSDISSEYFEVVSSSRPKPQIFDQEGNALLVEFNLNGTIHNISNQDIALTHFWQNHIIGFDNISYQIDNLHGGYVRLSFGGVSLNPEMLINDWTPPVSCPVTVYITADYEENKDEIFSGTAHLETFNKDEISYQFYAKNNDIMLLEETYPYDDQALDIVSEYLKWTLSAVGTSVYYCDILAGGDPNILEPARVLENFEEMTKGTATSLTAGQWDYGDYDTLGFSTVYVRISDNTDPDTKDAGYLRADYVEDKVPVPKAFGRVEHASPLRLSDRNGLPTYHKGGLIGDLADEKQIESFSYAGSYTRVAVTDHGLLTGDEIIISETTYYNGVYTAIRFTLDLFWIKKSYKTETVNTGKVSRNATVWNVYDDGVSITENIVDNGDGTFSLAAMPVGEVTISGTGQDSELSDIFEWACGVSRLNLTYDNEKAADPSPTVNSWESSQKILVDFLSDISAWNIHLFNIYTLTLFLVSMNTDNGSRNITEFESSSFNYKENPPISIVKAEWQTRVSANQTGGGKLVKEVKHLITVNGLYAYGSEKSFTLFDYEESVVKEKLTNILNILNKKQVTLQIPFDGVMPKPGEKISWIEESTVQNTEMSIRVRSVQYDFNNDSVSIEGNEI